MPDGISRIGDRATFQAFRRTRWRCRQGPVAVAHVPATPGDDRVRVAYAVGRRVGGAVVRNRVRRQLRAVMRSLHAAGALSPGAYLVSVFPGADRLRFADLHRLVVGAVDRLGSRSR